MSGARGRVRRRVPDRMLAAQRLRKHLRRSRAALEELIGEHRREPRRLRSAVDARQRFRVEVVRPAAARRTCRPPNALPGEALAALRTERALSAPQSGPSSAGSGLRSTPCPRSATRSAVTARHRDGLRDAPDPGRLHRPPPGGRALFEDYLRELAAEQRLVAPVASEAGTGGDMGRSVAWVIPQQRTARAASTAPTVRVRGRPLHDAAPRAERGAGRPGRRPQGGRRGRVRARRLQGRGAGPAEDERREDPGCERHRPRREGRHRHFVGLDDYNVGLATAGTCSRR